jgi:hypothetical protein
MSNANVQTRVTAPDPGVPSRTLTYYGQIAVHLSALFAAFCRCSTGLPSRRRSGQAISGTEAASAEGLHRNRIGAAITSEDLKSVRQLDTDRSLDRRQYIDAFKPLHDQLIVVEKALGFSIKVKEALLAADAQKIYEVAKELARNRDGGEIVTHMQNMKRDLGNRKHRAKKK